ncbi:outer membrane beta-barrel protein [Marinifilum fragile]|uniref:outer membrane beta-barrel protein n=1 Tax=Marinifilum fragile TaxID=570161 RepID=UPI002AA92741|nr:outer membrane beta-barrel protein [Marinifilum fragile]
MLDENKHIDSLFADGLKGMSVEPNPEVWNAIGEKMAAARRKRRGVILFISTALAASVLLFFGIANRDLFISEPGGFPIEQLSDNSSSSNPLNQPETSGETSEKNEAKGEEKGNGVFIAENASNFAKHIVQPELSSKENQFEKESLLNSIPLGIKQLLNASNQIPESLQYQNAKKTEAIQLSAEDLIVMNNLLAMEQSKKDELRKNRWAIIGQISSAYSNEESATSANSGIVSFGGGVKVNYALGEKLALQTGFMYNRVGQDMGGSRMNMAFADPIAEGEANEINRQERSFLPSHTTAGKINYTGGSVEDRTNAEYLAASTYSSSDDLMQSFETIEVPILIRYNLTQKRLGVYLSGGFGANWIVENGVYQTSGSKRKIGEIENLRTTNFSSLFGLGFEYQLSPKVRIGLEPSFKYYLNSINKSSQFDYKPYSIGVQTGIRYNF